MACDFTITFTSTPAELVATAKTKVLENEGTFTGDVNAGSFYIPVLLSHIDGTYMISGRNMMVEISHKPFFLTCNQVKQYIEDNLG